MKKEERKYAIFTICIRGSGEKIMGERGNF